MESLETPIFSVTLCTLQVLVPVRSLRMCSVGVLPVAVSAVRPAAAELVGLGVNHGVHDLLGESAKQLLHVDGAVVETGHGEHVRRLV